MPQWDMANLKKHASLTSSAGNLLTRRFSRHPERYIEIYRVMRKYELHHVAAQFLMAHRHEEEDEEPGLDGYHAEDEEEDHAEGLASALEELGPSWIKLGQLMSTRPDLVPDNYIAALSRLQDTVSAVPSAHIAQVRLLKICIIA